MDITLLWRQITSLRSKIKIKRAVDDTAGYLSLKKGQWGVFEFDDKSISILFKNSIGTETKLDTV